MPTVSSCSTIATDTWSAIRSCASSAGRSSPAPEPSISSDGPAATNPRPAPRTLAIDIGGQVVADTINGNQFSGIGGAEDFVAGAGLELSDRSLICLPSTFTKDDELQSRIVPWFGPGAVITTPRHQVDVIVTEYGVAELEGKTVGERGEALAAIAHPQFRNDLLAAAERASNGRSPVA